MGCRRRKRAKTEAGAAVLLISDGHANAGITDVDQLEGLAAAANHDAVTTSTLGFGLGYDETLMRAIAAGGTGSELFAEHADDAMVAIAGEIDGLLAQSAQAASVFIRMAPACKQLLVVNDMPTVVAADGVLVELGSFYAGEIRRLVVTFDVPGVAALGLTEIAGLDFSWVELPALVQHSVTMPVHVNVLPGDQAAGRIPDPTVRTELAYLQTQRAKRAAAEHMSGGDAGAALARAGQGQGHGERGAARGAGGDAQGTAGRHRDHRSAGGRGVGGQPDQGGKGGVCGHHVEVTAPWFDEADVMSAPDRAMSAQRRQTCSLCSMAPDDFVEGH